MLLVLISMLTICLGIRVVLDKGNNQPKSEVLFPISWLID